MSSEIQRAGVGEFLSQAVVHDGTVYLAGQVDTDGATVAEQTRAVLARIDERLAEVGSDKSKLLSATIWLTDMDTFPEMNAVWGEWLGSTPPPARATVEARLADPRFRVEIMAVAAA